MSNLDKVTDEIKTENESENQNETSAVENTTIEENRRCKR